MVKTLAKRFVHRAFGITERLPADRGVLFTFDDGPDAAVTPHVLELLAAYEARAVFFIVGSRIHKSPSTLADILSGGHMIGNHSFEHRLEDSPAFFDYYRDLKSCQEVLHAHTDQLPRLFRPPMGWLTTGSLLAPRMLGLRTLLWSVDVEDWKLRDRAAAVDVGHRLAQEVENGDVVLLHDDNPCAITVLEVALPLMQKRGIVLNRALGALCAPPA